MRKIFTAFAAAAALAAFSVGCGAGTPPSPSGEPPHPATTFVCHPKKPAQAGECIRQELEAKGQIPAAPAQEKTFGQTVPLGFFSATGIDISVYQGVPSFFQARLAGLRFVIVQTNDGTFRNRRFYEQTRALRSSGLPFGFYAFVEAFSGAEQANVSASMVRGQGGILGDFADTEVSGSYGQACPFVNQAHADGFRIVGVYASPGNYSGGRCQGIIWPAEWGGGRAYPLNGYPYSAIKVRQNCGTCRFTGVSGEVDRDEDLGLLALAEPAPKPTPNQLHAKLVAELSRRNAERGFLTRHHCRQPPWHVAVGLSGRPNGRYEHACHVELAHGHATNKAIADLRREGAR